MMKEISRFSIPNEDFSSYTTSSAETGKNQRKIVHFPAQSMNWSFLPPNVVATYSKETGDKNAWRNVSLAQLREARPRPPTKSIFQSWGGDYSSEHKWKSCYFSSWTTNLIPKRKEEVGVVSCQFYVAYVLKKWYLTSWVACQACCHYIRVSGGSPFTETCTCIIHWNVRELLLIFIWVDLLAYNALFHSRRTTGMESVRCFPYRANAYYTMTVWCNDDPSKLNTPAVVSFKNLFRCFVLILASKM